MRLGFGLGVTAPSVLARVSAVAEFTMTQLPKANKTFQRVTDTGGGQNKGAGTIPVQVNVTSAGTIFRRIRSAADDTILQPAASLGTVGTGAQTLSVPADARLGWFYVDLAPTADGPWTSGTTRVGMGGLTLGTGQSQMSRAVGRTSGASGTIASNGITVSPYGVVYATYADTRTVTSPAWALPADGSNYDATAVAEFLRLQVAEKGVNWGFVGHSVGGSSVNGWQPGNTHFNNLLPILAEVDGFESWWNYLGGTDAGAGTTGAAYKTGLTNIFNELVARNLVRGSNFQRYITIAATRLAGGDGTAAQVTALRVAGKEWAAANSGVYIEPHDVTLLDDVHQDQAGGVTLARHLFRAMVSDDVGPTITGGTRSGTVITLPVQHGSGATALVRVGNPASRFSVYPAGTVTGALALASTDGVTVTANAITLNLAADPGAGVAVDVYALRHPDPSGTSAQSSMVYDNRNPEGFAFGRHVQPTHVPVQVAAPGGTVSAPDAPTATATAYNGQNIIAYADGASNGGATVTARPLYRSTTANFTPGPGNLLQANPTYPFTDAGLMNGAPYFYKVGATNSAGTTLSAEVSATPSATANLLDTFTDADGTALSAHTGESGHTWSTTNGTDAAIRTNRVAAGTVPCNLLSSYVPVDVAQSIIAGFTALSTAAQNTLIRFRIQSDNTYYYAGKVNNGSNKWVIGYTINGTTNNAAISTADIPGTTGTTYAVRVEDGGVGGVIRLLINDVVVAQLTDNQPALNSKGRIGLRYSLGAAGTGVGMHVTSIRTEASAAGDTTAPTVTSSPTGTVSEGQAYSVTLAANEPVTWSLRGGGDSALFALSGATLSLAARDFEFPQDGGADNTYLALLRATDAAGNATDFAHTVTVTDVAEAANVVAPSIQGQPIEGTSFVLDVGAWDGDYATLETALIDQTDAFVLPRAARGPDEAVTLSGTDGKTLRLRVWAVNAGGQTVGVATSAPFGPIQTLTHVLSLFYATSGTNSQLVTPAGSTTPFKRVAGTNAGANLYADDSRNSNPNPGMTGLKHGAIGSNPAAQTFSSSTTTPPDPRFAVRATSFVTDPTIWAERIDVPVGGSNKYALYAAAARGGVAVNFGFRVYDGIPGAGGTLVATLASATTGAGERVRDASGTIYADPAAWAAVSDAGGVPIEVTCTTGILCVAPVGTANVTPAIEISVWKKP